MSAVSFYKRRLFADFLSVGCARQSLSIALVAALCTILTVPMPAFADAEKIRIELARAYPEVPIQHVREIGTTGLWEVFSGTGMVYTDKDASFLLRGEMIQVSNKQSLTAARLDTLIRVSYDSIPIDQAIIIRKGNGSRKIALFSDPRCPHCKRLEAELEQLTDVQIFVYPTPSLGPASATLIDAIWCAKDPLIAWRESLLRDVVPQPSNECTPVAAKNRAFVQSNGIRGTPVIVYADGYRSSGFRTVDEVERRIAAALSGPASTAATATHR